MSNSHDANGREYLKLSNAKEGMKVQLDSGFSCASEGEVILFMINEELCFACANGNHAIEGQADDDGIYCMGIYP